MTREDLRTKEPTVFLERFRMGDAHRYPSIVPGQSSSDAWSHIWKNVASTSVMPFSR